MNKLQTTLSRPFIISLLVIVAGGLAGLGSHAVSRTLLGPRQPVVATINISALFAGLEQRADVQRKIEQELVELRDEIQQRERELLDLKDRLEAMPEDERPEHLRDQLAMDQLRFEIWADIQMQEAEINRTTLFEDLFRTVQREAANLAKAQQIDMIVFDDSTQPLRFDPRAPRDAQVEMQIMRRRLLYIEPTLDITEQLKTRMNNRFRAIQPQESGER